ncbi:hypothetical protein Q787_08900 [Ornithobacterium rhinotracheale H06-030791]|nr:hypothetical protein Q785_09085 [Ornithobacterium rhinotracheale ORT-UMN 88]KGB66258.1 hypothetical protein Q787_08900 [Ornithobacterium rhinotracheale H06-030791]
MKLSENIAIATTQNFFGENLPKTLAVLGICVHTYISETVIFQKSFKYVSLRAFSFLGKAVKSYKYFSFKNHKNLSRNVSGGGLFCV